MEISLNIQLNGEKVLTKHSTLFELIRETGFEPQSLVAELNFEVIKEDLWPDTKIKDGDQVELLSFVGGG